MHPFVRSTCRTRAVFLFLAAALAGAGCGDRGRRPATTSAGGGQRYQTVAAERKDLLVTAAATGLIEPVRVVEVKSKASGEILNLPVESGDRVERGALLAQLDKKDVANSYARAEAALEVARARFAIAEGQMARSKQLLERQAVSREEHEQVELEHANARAALVTAQIDLDLAKERREDTTVRAPIAGVIIQKGVEEGQIISSATSQVTGGTTLMRMADLEEVQVRALVDETDIGRIHEEQEVRISVDAYPDEKFTGRVLKVEPQAVIEQNVTTFPVLVRITNEKGLLLPGMNCEVEIEIHRRENVVVVPNEAVRTPAEARQTAMALGVAVEGLEGPGDNAGGRGAAEAAAPRPAGGAAGATRPGGRRQAIVFVVDGDHLAARPVSTGVSNWDDTEIIDGLADGEKVAVMLSTQLLREQAEFRQRMQRVSGVPGLQREGGQGGQGGGAARSGTGGSRGGR
jgi:HlyD family secretion protein